MNHPMLPTIPAPALPEPVHEDLEGGEIPVAAIVAAAAKPKPKPKRKPRTKPADHGGTEGDPITPSSDTKRRRSVPVTFHEALTFASRGIYVDIESNQVRCSCNHKPCNRWDAYGYTRHFAFKCHKKYEAERLDEGETQRLREAKETYFRMNPIIEESCVLRKKRKLKDGEKVLSVEELRVQERHWMEMWIEAKNELRQVRSDFRTEEDEEVRAELAADIDGLKKRKADWGRLLGLDEVYKYDLAKNDSITL